MGNSMTTARKLATQLDREGMARIVVHYDVQEVLQVRLRRSQRLRGTRRSILSSRRPCDILAFTPASPAAGDDVLRR